MASSKDASKDEKRRLKQPNLQINRSSTVLYDLILWILARTSFTCHFLHVLVMLDVFFREIRSRGSYRIPRHGAVIFVAAPHANQV